MSEKHEERSKKRKTGLAGVVVLLVVGILHLALYYVAHFELVEKLSDDVYLNAGRWVATGIGALVVLMLLGTMRRGFVAFLMSLVLLPVALATVALPTNPLWIEHVPTEWQVKEYIDLVEDEIEKHMDSVIDDEQVDKLKIEV